MDRLPLTAIDGQIVSTGMYPTGQQLAQKLGIALTPTEKPKVSQGGSCCSPKSGCC